MPTATRPTAPHLKLRSTQPRGVAIAGMATAVALVIVVLLGLVVLTAKDERANGGGPEPASAEGPPSILEHMSVYTLTGAGTALMADVSHATGASPDPKLSDQEETP